MAIEQVIRVRGTSKVSWEEAARSAARTAYNEASKQRRRTKSLRVVELTAKIEPNPGGIQVFQTLIEANVGP